MEKEVSELDKICKLASNWWYNTIQNPKFDNGDETRLSSILGILAVQKAELDQYKLFKEKLYNKIKEELLKRNESDVFILSCDYSPDRNLCNIADQCNISLNNFPWKTTMWVSRNHIKVSYGYRNPFNLLYANETYFENQLNDIEKSIKFYKEKPDDYFVIGTKEEVLKEQYELKEQYIKLKEEFCNNK